VRALGRLERPELVPNLVPVLSAPQETVRAEAAHALAQAAGQDRDASRVARVALSSRLATEKERDVRAAICEALGRLALDMPEQVATVERLLLEEVLRAANRKRVHLSPASPRVGLTIGWGGDRRTAVSSDAIGALRGLEALARLRGKVAPPSAAAVQLLRSLAVNGEPPVRRLALLTLNVSAAVDEDDAVRRLAMASPAATADLLVRGLDDSAAQVRYEALRAYGRHLQAEKGCRPVLAATRDVNAHVALLALDLLGNGCAERELAEETLSSEAAVDLVVGAGGKGWHRPAHALVSLARVSPSRAAAVLPRFLAAEPALVRTYAAKAAAQLGDASSLEALAGDPNANVREAAISALAKTKGHGADDTYLRAVAADDGQAVMTAARALAGTPRREDAAAAVAAALARWTERGSDTSRDPRLVLIERLQEVGSKEMATAALGPLLLDFDARVAERAAEAVTALTGEPALATPRLRPVPPVPSAQDVQRLSRARVRVTMKGGRRFELQLLTDVAPLFCAAFARLVSARYYDGLTFHRVVPNFVLQGGSPGANEFSGDSRFILDEVGRTMQARGTVGSSTRGRDTGDGQFYVNLVDNPRLDHDYTVFARVVSGMEVVDSILEGDVMERVELVR
jgi:cyclophilin family peptidyl-prolyl cis-trans isomerase/HEAT repeat protein